MPRQCPAFAAKLTDNVARRRRSLGFPQSYQPKRFSGIGDAGCRGREGPEPVNAIRLIVAVAGARPCGRPASCAQRTDPVPLPAAKPAALDRPKPRQASTKTAKAKTAASRKAAGPRHDQDHGARRQAHKGAAAPLSLLAPAPAGPVDRADPVAPASRECAAGPCRAGRAPSLRYAPALAMATTSTTSPMDIAAVKQAFDLVAQGPAATTPPISKARFPIRWRASWSNG